MFYWVVKAVLAPILRLLFRPWAEGTDYVPRTGPAILASNHLSFSDHFFAPLPLPRKVVFLAKSEYFTGRGVKGLFSKAFFSGVGQIPVDRSGGEASALEARVPVIPCAMVGGFEFQPPGKITPQFKVRPGVRFGKPLDFSRYYGLETDRIVLRAVTDEIIYEIMKLSGQEYVDEYAARHKALQQAAKRAQRQDAKGSAAPAAAEAEAEAAGASGAADGASSSADGASGAQDGASGAQDGSSGAPDGASGAADGASGSVDGVASSSVDSTPGSVSSVPGPVDSSPA
jgi:1-acyl-sn-glycerol-3-phosphate acyltransferase